MISTTMDIWLDSARYDRETLSDLRDNLVRVFNLPTHKADTLVNGNAHRIKRACSQEEAEKLTKQFASWGIELRIEASTGEESRDTEEAEARTASMFTLAPHGDSIPNLMRDKTPPNVRTDHLHLTAE